MARSRTGGLRRWAPYVGVLVTAAMLTISSNIAHMEQEDLYTASGIDVDTIYEGQHWRDTADTPMNESVTTDATPSIEGCKVPFPDMKEMNHTQIYGHPAHPQYHFFPESHCLHAVQWGRELATIHTRCCYDHDRRLREMWRNCNRCTTTVAPHMTSHPSNVTSCGWQKRVLVPKMLNNLLVDDKHKTMYCVIPKVACTNWKRALVKLSGRLNTTNEESFRTLDVHDEVLLNQIGLRYLSTYPLQEIRDRMESYYKFMFVRHPLERLLSAYRDKFIQHNKWNEHFQLKYGRKIVKTHRRNPTEESLQAGDDVTFQEFVRYVIDTSYSGRAQNPHWSSYYDICHPCSIRYDFVGRFETFDVDAPYILSKISGSACPPDFPNMRPTGASTRQVLIDYYNQISKSDISKIVQVFLPDFIMFGYDLNFPAYLHKDKGQI